MPPDLLQVIDVILVPVIGGIVVWIWKLDERVFDIRAALIGREEFRAQMQELRTEIADLRTAVLNMSHTSQ